MVGDELTILGFVGAGRHALCTLSLLAPSYWCVHIYLFFCLDIQPKKGGGGGRADRPRRAGAARPAAPQLGHLLQRHRDEASIAGVRERDSVRDQPGMIGRRQRE